MIGERIRTDLEIANPDNEVCPLNLLLHGAEALVAIFCPYCFGDASSQNSMESLLLDVNENIEEFNSQDLRVICITREPPSTNRHWMSDKDLKMEVYSDASLKVSSALVGTFDLSLYLMATKNIPLGTFYVSMPAVLVVGGDGKIISKYVASSPDAVQITAKEILRMAGAT